MATIRSALIDVGYAKKDLRTDNQPKCDARFYTEDFAETFLPHLIVVGDSREQKDWIEKACEFYGIRFEKAVKDKKAGTENLKEGDYTFKMQFGDKIEDYTGIVAYERKGSISELYNNFKNGDRERIQREFMRFSEKGYKKVVLVVEYGENIVDLINGKFEFIGHDGYYQQKDVGKLVFATIMAWKQNNGKNFEIYQNTDHPKMFWWILTDMYYWWRNELFNKQKQIKESEENVNSIKNN